MLDAHAVACMPLLRACRTSLCPPSNLLCLAAWPLHMLERCVDAVAALMSRVCRAKMLALQPEARPVFLQLLIAILHSTAQRVSRLLPKLAPVVQHLHTQQRRQQQQQQQAELSDEAGRGLATCLRCIELVFSKDLFVAALELEVRACMLGREPLGSTFLVGCKAQCPPPPSPRPHATLIASPASWCTGGGIAVGD